MDRFKRSLQPGESDPCASHTHTHRSGYTDLQLCSRFNVVLFHYVIGGIGDTADSRSQHLIYWGMSEARAGVLS